MTELDRRTFLKLIGAPAIASAVSLDLSKALAIPAARRTGTIEDVEHVIFLMQENRSFDHVFGTMRGVRGFGDPHPIGLSTGKSVWHQPHGGGELLPFRPAMKDVGQAFLPDPPHGWNDTHGAWNDGRHDAWVPNKGIPTMTYHERRDLPYQYALADAFTVCDNYHCSLLGPTDPNRYYMWTGWVGNDGRGGGPVVDNAEAGYDWSTYPERLQRAGVSWRVYQDVGKGLDADGSWGWTDDPYIGNYGDNSLLYFNRYRHAEPGTPLAERAKTGTEVRKQNRRPEALLADLRRDVSAGRLPAVSWIVAPEAYSEHPNWRPDFGAWYVSQVIDILTSNPDVWSKMAMFVTYDEEGGFFDHLVPPTPPRTRAEGLSTVSVDNEVFAGSGGYRPGPYGLGMRVPMIVVSPWTRGGYVDSQLFDHSSLIRFLEARFAKRGADLVESNITPWRRAVVGDLTSAFDFATPNSRHRLHLPDTDDFKPRRLVRHDDDVPKPPEDQRVPTQEHGVRRARPIPYTLHCDARARDGALHIDFGSAGRAAAVFHVRSADHKVDPRTYTVESGKQLTDTWRADAPYDLTVHGPNGFFRRFAGGGPAHVEVTAAYGGRDVAIELMMLNRGSAAVQVSVRDRYGSKDRRLTLQPGKARLEKWSLSDTHGWYDLTVTAHGDAHLAIGCAGHVEDGAESISDPLMGGLVQPS